MTFPGFPARAQSTAIPNVFFSDLLPKLTDPVALGVALYAFTLLSRKRGFPRYITAAELAADAGAVAFFAALPVSDIAGAVRRGLARAVEVGVVRMLEVEADGDCIDLVFLNAPADLRGMEAVRSGTVAVGRVVERAATPDRTSIFTMYESLMGTLSPLIAGELTEAERLYPAAWIEAAFREAAAQNARSWRYVTRILERWATEGPDHATTERDPAADDRYFRGKYGRILRDRLKS